MNRPTTLRVLITAGPTWEPIDPVRYIGNRSSGRMGAALAAACVAARYATTAIVGPITTAMSPGIDRIDIETAAQMQSAVLGQFPAHDLLIMAAAVADFRPKAISPGKLSRERSLKIECEPTEDIVAAAAGIKRPEQRIIGFSLESAGRNAGGVDRAREKLERKHLDMIVYNPVATMNSPSVGAVLLYADGKSEVLPVTSKVDFAALLISRAAGLF